MQSSHQQSICHSYKTSVSRNSFQVEINSCSERSCTSGKLIVDEMTSLANEKGVEHNLFLNRYPEAVTNNGEIINANDSATTGYGIWRVTETQFDMMLSSSTFSKADISDDLVANYNVRLRYLLCTGINDSLVCM